MNFIQDGWPGATRFPLPGAERGCGCGSFPPLFPPERDCDRGRPLFLDSAQVIYHLFNNQLSNLRNLGLPNGTPAQVIFDAIDGQLGNIIITNWFIPNLKSFFPTTNFNSLQLFGQAVDSVLGTLNSEIITISGSSSIPLSSNDTESIHFILSGTLNRNISAQVLISNASGNTISVLPDGLFGEPQNLSVDYTNNRITITDGNTVQLPNAPVGYLGNLSADPGSAIDGNMWYNTSTNHLKIKANGTIINLT